MTSLSRIKPYANNPRQINDSAVNAVAESIEVYGWQNPIVVDKNHVIICGHTRYKAAEKLGLDEVPVIIARHLTQAQVRELRIVDNKSHEKAIWDYPALQREFAKIDLKQEIISLNFTHVELQAIKKEEISAPAPPSGPQEDDDEYEAPKKKYKIKLNEAQHLVFSVVASKIRDFDPERTDGQIVEEICNAWLKNQ